MITTPEGASEIHIVLHSENQRVAGFSGCNNMMGSYVLEGDKLRFGQMGSTMMACVGTGMELETKFLSVFPQVAHWEIRGETLQLRDADGKSLANFESRYLNSAALVCGSLQAAVIADHEPFPSSRSPRRRVHWRSSPLRCASLKPQSRQRSRAS